MLHTCTCSYTLNYWVMRNGTNLKEKLIVHFALHVSCELAVQDQSEPKLVNRVLECSYFFSNPCSWKQATANLCFHVYIFVNSGHVVWLLSDCGTVENENFCVVISFILITVFKYGNSYTQLEGIVHVRCGASSGWLQDACDAWVFCFLPRTVHLLDRLD